MEATSRCSSPIVPCVRIMAISANILSIREIETCKDRSRETVMPLKPKTFIIQKPKRRTKINVKPKDKGGRE